VPVEYETAVNALAECINLDEAKHWADKADALAAWAKIYRNDEAGIKSRQLKLHAYRRMGEIAKELRPVKNTGRGSSPGPRSLLREQGLSEDQVIAAAHLSKLPKDEFTKLIDAPKPPSPTLARRASSSFSNSTENWKAFVMSGQSASAFRGFCRNHPARALAQGLSPDEKKKALEYIREISDWIDEFERHLTKAKS